MDEDSKLRELMWRSLLNADMNARYYAGRARSLSAWDKGMRILVAIAGSATVSGWFLWDTPGWEWVWPTFSVIAAAVGIALPVFNLSTGISCASELSGAWSSILADYELLWTQEDRIEEQEALRRVSAIQDSERPLAQKEACLRIRRHTLEQSYYDVCKSRGI